MIEIDNYTICNGAPPRLYRVVPVVVLIMHKTMLALPIICVADIPETCIRQDNHACPTNNMRC